MNEMNHKPLVSLCLIVKNEAEHLATCLESVRGVVDEIIVVDTGSTDATIQTAERCGGRVISFPWIGDFASARNAGIVQAQGTWILILDADEELDQESKEELRLCASHLEYEGFFVRIHNHLGTDKYSPTATVNPILRMFRNRPEHLFRGIIHEQIAVAITEYRPNAALHISSINVHHYGYTEKAVIEKDKIRRNVTLLTKELQQSPNDPFQHFNMAVEYMRLGEHQNALNHIHTSMKLTNPDTSYGHLLNKYEIRCHYALGKVTEALHCCEQAILLYPDYTDLFHLKGAISLANGKLQEATVALTKAVELGPPPPHYHTETGVGTYLSTNMLGQIAEEIGNHKEAIEWYTKSALYQPESVQTTHRIFRILKCSDLEMDIPELLTNHLHIQDTAVKKRIIAWLALDGCYQAAATLISHMNESTTDDSEMIWRSLLSSEQSVLPNLTHETLTLAIPFAYQFGQEAKAFELLRAWELRYLNETRTSSIPFIDKKQSQKDISKSMKSTELVMRETYDLSRTWTSLADALLSRSEPTSTYYSTIQRVRLMLPLPRLPR